MAIYFVVYLVCIISGSSIPVDLLCLAESRKIKDRLKVQWLHKHKY